MNLFRDSFLAAMMLTLTGCAQQSQAPASDNSVHWWNPFSYTWASVLPWSWSGGTPVVSEQGVGKLNAMTPFTQTALASGLSRDYTLRQGMGTRNGHIDSYWPAIKNGQPVMTLSGETTLSRVEVTDPDAKGPGGVRIGSPFADHYTKAFGQCQLAADSQQVECQAPNSRHLHYLYSGEFHGPRPSGINAA